ncbi:hypothetical protein FACS1894105_05920 [Clostridia bacterium]|nr:hypothetical protein FACS1894105_05920 [Clostridia bacterium]
MELTIIQQNGGAYIDSREVAEAIGKRHKDLLRDIRKYDEIIRRFTGRIFTPSDFFVQSSYFDPTGRELPCYLITRRGADVIANKLTGEKGVLFTAAYVTRFHELSEREHEREVETLKKQAITPRLAVFNKAIRTVIGGLNAAHASADTVLTFLQDSYKPFGIPVADIGDQSRFYSASTIARALGVYSHTGRPHAHAVSAIIGKLDIDLGGHVEIAPYGLVGFSARYDIAVAEAVEDWLIVRGKPHDIPHEYFEYHICYEGELPPYSGGDYDNDCNLDGDAISAYLRKLTMDELNELCAKYDECEICPYLGYCPSTYDIDLN